MKLTPFEIFETRFDDIVTSLVEHIRSTRLQVLLSDMQDYYDGRPTYRARQLMKLIESELC
ncbi:hypothetical protein NCCP2716_23200 [Sporosarcina sp. NCCP-2716]|uniref:hypothetical protein n=1 Tax=Sporosarcina sp. NCCP-2716 TaxID=2943679 RepID=UPI002040DFC5|nr:hypothetical protein [Sporosarcina sp. NCCP-2716]GKV69822.1 hypothetical protein NCCP2716_23200 [Sporosarcina sp. NCCP-2716]